MKIKSTLTAIAAVATFGLIGANQSAEAGPRFHFSIGGGPSHFGHSGFSNRYGYGNHGWHNSGGHCNSGRSYHRAPRVVRTYEIGRCQRRQVFRARCGTPYHRYVTVVTFQSLYSDGSRRNFTRTY